MFDNHSIKILNPQKVGKKLIFLFRGIEWETNTSKKKRGAKFFPWSEIILLLPIQKKKRRKNEHIDEILH